MYDSTLTTEIIGCDDCGPCGLQSVLDVVLDPGTYLVVLEGFSGSEGDYHLEVSDAFSLDLLQATLCSLCVLRDEPFS